MATVSTANRNRRAIRRELIRQRHDTIRITEHITRTRMVRYILHNDGSRTFLLDAAPYWHGMPPVGLINLSGIPECMNGPTFENNGISREGY